VDGDGTRVAFSAQRSAKETPELVVRLWHDYTAVVLRAQPTLPSSPPFTPQVLVTTSWAHVELPRKDSTFADAVLLLRAVVARSVHAGTRRSAHFLVRYWWCHS